MGLITAPAPYTFVANTVPTATNFNANPTAIVTLLNGNLDSANCDTSSSDGIMTLDVVQTRTAALTQKAAFTVGVDDTGHDVKFFGATSGKSWLWDESADEMIVTGKTTLTGGDTFIGNGQGIVVGHTAQVTAAGFAAEHQVLGTADADARMILGRFSNDGGQPAFTFLKSKGATIGGSGAVTDNTLIAQIQACVDDGNDYASSIGDILIEVDDASPAQDQVGGAMVLRTTATTGNSPTERMRIDSAGDVGIGEAVDGGERLHVFDAFDLLNCNSTYGCAINDTANANMGVGLTINQGTEDNEILAFKSSDVAHGVTTLTETDTYSYFQKQAGTGGGRWVALTDDVQAHYLISVATNDNTTKTTAGTAPVNFDVRKKTGTTTTSPGADANLVTIGPLGTTRYIFDVEGSAHADVEWTTYDKHDDIALINDMESELLLHEDDAKTHRRHALEAVGVIGKDSWHMENGKPRAMVNFTKLSMLHHGALIQIGQAYDALKTRLELAESKLKMLEA